jgi:hypothetical protein
VAAGYIRRVTPWLRALFERHPRRCIAFAVIAGSLVRLVYGLLFQPWLQQPDQLAWELVVGTSGPDAPTLYQRLIHYPHEGGTIPLAILALLVGPIACVPALSIIALLFDTGSRLVQLLVVRKTFPTDVLVWYAAFSALPIPGLLPWGTVNYGLHALAAFIPFVILWLTFREQRSHWDHAVDGVLIGLFSWFSYSTAVLIPLYIAFRRDLFARPIAWAGWLGGLVGVIVAHIAVRALADPGFHLPDFAPSTIRGMALDGVGGKFSAQWLGTWTSAFPGSSMLPPMLGFPAAAVRRIWALMILAGLVLALVAWWKERGDHRPLIFCVLVLLAFGAVYSASPFFHGRPDREAFVHYRHWPFILPMGVLAAVGGLCTMKRAEPLLRTFLVFSLVGSLIAFTLPKERGPKAKETGYVLAIKFGHAPETLAAIARQDGGHEADLMRGAGWGTLETLMIHGGITDDAVDVLGRLATRYDPPERRWFREGLALGLSRDPCRDLPSDLRERIKGLTATPAGE